MTWRSFIFLCLATAGVISKRPRRESNSHLRFRKPPFYPLNYGDGRKGKVERLKEKIQRVDFALRISSLYWRHRKFSRARDRRRSRRSFTKSFDSPCGSFNIPKYVMKPTRKSRLGVPG